MREDIKRRLAILLSILFVLPAIITLLPTKAVWAAKTYTSLYPWKTAVTVEEGVEFYFGDYVSVYQSGGTYFYGTASQVKATYSSADKSVATIDDTGYLKALEPGESKITVKYKKQTAEVTLTVVEEGTFGTSTAATNLAKAADALGTPTAITTANGFDWLKKGIAYRKVADAVENNISRNGFLKEKQTSESSGYTWYVETEKLAVPQAGRYETLLGLIDVNYQKNGATSTRSAKVLKIKSVSATRNAVTVKVKSKADTAGIMAEGLHNLSGSDTVKFSKTQAAITLYLIDSTYTTTDSYRIVGTLKKGSKTIKFTPYKYDSKKQAYVKAKLPKGKAWQLGSIYDWTKGKSFTVK